MKSINSILWLSALALIDPYGHAGAAQNERSVVVKPGQNIQDVVANSPLGTRFHFEPGIYRQQTIYPKSGQEFIGQAGVILSGAMELKSWTNETGIWKHEGLPRALDFDGECEDGRDLCKFREDLFIDGRLYRRVGSLSELGPGKWYYDNHRAYLADDPTGQSAELGVTQFAFGGDAENVVLKDLIVEKYASDAQQGAIHLDDADGWRIDNVTARWNHGTGLRFGPNTRVQGGSFSHNGQMGMVGVGEDSTVQNVEIAYNNYARYDPGWEGGGTKFALTRGLVVQGSCVHHNHGPGLWTDIDNLNVVYDGNTVFLNASAGIKHEISYDAIIRNNVVAYNGSRESWLFDSQILIQNSSNTLVYGNTVHVSNRFGAGIGVIHQDRDSGIFGPRITFNNNVYDNTIVHLGSLGESGVVMDTGDDQFWQESDNRFDRNVYVVPHRRGKHWIYQHQSWDWYGVKEMGLEVNGKLVVEQRSPISLSCKLDNGSTQND